MDKIEVKELFNDLQEEMIAKLKTNSKAIKHPGAKGDTTELNWIEWLRSYLPKRYTVDKGFVVDHEGSLSQQIDVIIYDTQYCPFIFNKDGVKYIPAESVYAVFEVKQTLNAEYIKYASEKAKSVRVLKRTTKPISGAERDLKPKTPKNIICGLLSTNSSWIKDEANHIASNLVSDINSRLDYICSLKTKSYRLQFLKDKVSVEQSENNESLIFLFINIFASLQEMGNPPAMDIMSYARAIESI